IRDSILRSKLRRGAPARAGETRAPTISSELLRPSGGLQAYFTPALQRLMTREKRIKAAPAITGTQSSARKSPGSGRVTSILILPASSPAIRLPSELPRNQVPIICPTNRGGASFVTELSPTGLRQSSPNVCTR